MSKKIFRKIFKKKCPVCHTYVSSDNAPFKSELNGKDYFFYSRSCMEKFEKNPKKVLTRKKEFLFGFLPKNHEGVPRSCHDIKATIKRAK